MWRERSTKNCIPNYLESMLSKGEILAVNKGPTYWTIQLNRFPGIHLIICKKQNEITIIEEAKVNNVPFEKLGYFNNGIFKIGKETTQIDELKIIFDNGLDELIN